MARTVSLTEAEKERRTATCQRIASALTAWRSGTERGADVATMTSLSWTRVCSWTGHGPSSENRP